jgi:serpin B
MSHHAGPHPAAHDPSVPVSIPRSSRAPLYRNAEISLPNADWEHVAASNNTFALNLYHMLHTDDENLFCSPYNLWSLIIVAYAGARGNTATELQQALYVDPPSNEQAESVCSFERFLTTSRYSRYELEEQEFGGRPASPIFHLYIAKAFCGQSGMSLTPDFLTTLTEEYGIEMQWYDFVQQYEEARNAINQWVNEQTQKQIPSILPPGSLNADTQLVLASAIYFKAKWLYPFDEENTEDGPFHLLSGDTITVPMMSETFDHGIRFQQTETCTAFLLPYEGIPQDAKRDQERAFDQWGCADMLIIMPNPGTFQQFEQTLTNETLNDILANMSPGFEKVHVIMPRFRLQNTFELKEVLQQLGIHDAFELGTADFSGISVTPPLAVSEVYHAAMVNVDEKGTEAAASSAMVMATLSVSSPPPVLKIDHPFLFVIRDTTTGAFLFMGHVLDPSQE